MAAASRIYERKIKSPTVGEKNIARVGRGSL
jgi:hypothetical protein